MSSWILDKLQTGCYRGSLNLAPCKQSKLQRSLPWLFGEASEVLGKLIDVPELFKRLEALVVFSVLKNVPFDLVNGLLTLKLSVLFWTLDQKGPA